MAPPIALRSALAVCIVAVMTASHPVSADDPPKKSAPDIEAANLVKQLGSKRFAERETAEKKLVALGTKAKPSVLAGVKDSDPEITRRCEAIIKLIRSDEREAFGAGKSDWPGPAAKKFRDVVGESEASRRLFAEILQDDMRTVILERVGESSKEAATAFATERTRLKDAGHKAIAVFDGQPFPSPMTDAMRDASRKAVEPGDVALVLFLATLSREESTRKLASVQEVLSASFIDLARGPLKEPFRKLFAAWLELQTHDEVVNEGLEGALFVPMPEALPVARRLSKDPNVSARVIANALLLLGNYGKPEDISYLTPFRKDTRRHCGYKVWGGNEQEVQLRDLAAAMSLTLWGEDFRKYGFHPNSVIAWWSGSAAAAFKNLHVFETAEERDAAQKKAWDWLDKRAKESKK